MPSDFRPVLHQALRQLQQAADALEREPASAPSAGWVDALKAYLALDADWAADQTFESLLRAAVYVVRAAGAELTLFDRERRQLIVRAAVGAGCEGEVGKPVPLTSSLSGLAFNTGEIQSSRPLFHGMENDAEVVFKSVLVAPLVFAGESIGTLAAVNKIDADSFSEADIAAFQHFSEVAAQMVHRKQREFALIAALSGGLHNDETLKRLGALGHGSMEDFAQLQALARLQREMPHTRSFLAAVVSFSRA